MGKFIWQGKGSISMRSRRRGISEESVWLGCRLSEVYFQFCWILLLSANWIIKQKYCTYFLTRKTKLERLWLTPGSWFLFSYLQMPFSCRCIRINVCQCLIDITWEIASILVNNMDSAPVCQDLHPGSTMLLPYLTYKMGNPLIPYNTEN